MVPWMVCGLENLYMIFSGEMGAEDDRMSEPTNALSLPYLPCRCSKDEDGGDEGQYDKDDEEEEQVDDACASLKADTADAFGARSELGLCC